MHDMQPNEHVDEPPHTDKTPRTAAYLLRFTPEEKAQLEQKVRVAAAAGEAPLSLAEALRTGAERYLDQLIERLGDRARSGQ